MVKSVSSIFLYYKTDHQHRLDIYLDAEKKFRGQSIINLSVVAFRFSTSTSKIVFYPSTFVTPLRRVINTCLVRSCCPFLVLVLINSPQLPLMKVVDTCIRRKKKNHVSNHEFLNMKYTVFKVLCAQPTIECILFKPSADEKMRPRGCTY